MKTFQLKRTLPTSKVTNYTPIDGEIVYDTNHNELRIGDGSTPGGKVLMGVENQTLAYQWKFQSTSGQKIYEPESTESRFKSSERGIYMVFYGGTKLDTTDYTINEILNQITLNADVLEEGIEIFVLYIANRASTDGVFQYECTSSTSTTSYTPLNEKKLRDPESGIYIVFYSAIKLVSDDYTINFENNTIDLNFTPEEDGLPITILFFSNN